MPYSYPLEMGHEQPMMEQVDQGPQQIYIQAPNGLEIDGMPQYGITPMEIAPVCLNNMIVPSDLENIHSPVIELPIDSIQ